MAKPISFAQFVEESGFEELEGVGAKQVPVADKSVMIALVNADAVKNADLERRREIVQAVTTWARVRLSGKWISGIILYNDALGNLMSIGAELTRNLQARRWPKRWSKDVL